MAKPRQSHVKLENKDFYIVLSKSILDLDLNPGEKIALGMIVSLARSTGKSTATMQTMANMIGVSKRTMQNYVKTLVEKAYLIFEWVGNNRHFKPLESLKKDTDAKAIITSDILKNKTLTLTYKITQGLLIARGINTDEGGYRFDSMEDLADYIGLSLSSAYRHIYELLRARTIKRHENHRYMFVSNDSYSKKKHKELKENHKSIEKSKELVIDPYVDSVLDEVFQSMR
jgi:DNA-binding MarR family transcriptional regulator